MKRFSSLISRPKKSSQSLSSSSTPNEADSPETTSSRAVRLFCESGSAANRDEEVLHLPVIVDAAESSPSAAAACAVQIREFLQKSYNGKPHVQYNAIMLVRILAENPGASFTKNFDEKFVKTVKTLLREGKDSSVQQILRETLDNLEAHRAFDGGVQGLVQMWRREKAKGASLRPVNMTATPRQASHASQGYSQPNQLPAAPELASRIEEARNTAKILIQFLQTTPSEDLSSNELIKEFADRCQGAQQSIQSYINCVNPPPDDNTLQTLIETNEQLSLANSRHQRAILAARRAHGTSPGPDTHSASAPVVPSPDTRPQTPPRPQENGFGMFGSTNSPTHSRPPAPLPAPITSHQSVARPPAIATNGGTPSRNTDYDDLYDSPAFARPPQASSDPFADPISAHDNHNAKTQADNAYGMSSTYSPGQPATSTSPAGGRPAIGAWHNSSITDSFLGRQASAANGITMHAPVTIPEGNADARR